MSSGPIDKEKLQELIQAAIAGDKEKVKRLAAEIKRAAAEARAGREKTQAGTPPARSWEDEEDDWEDIAKLSAVLDSIVEFIDKLEAPLSKLVKTLLGQLNGEELGREIAAFYKQLVDSGMPEDLAAELTRDLFRKKTSLGDLLGSILKQGFPGSKLAGKNMLSLERPGEKAEEKNAGENGEKGES